MKSNYLKPEMELCEIELESIIATSLTSNGTFNDEDGMTIGSKSRRGTWGDLWSEK